MYLENDVNAFTLGEKWLGEAKEYQNALCVTLGRGVGVGILINGTLFGGEHHGAGEIGHMKIATDPDAPLCVCGSSGCLEAFISNPAICNYVQKRIKDGSKSILQENEAITISEIQQAALSGDELCVKTYKRVGHFLGIGIANLINIFDPEVILIGGEGTVVGNLIYQEMKRTIHRNAVYGLDKEIQIKPIDFEDNLWVLGVATLVVQEIFKVSI